VKLHFSELDGTTWQNEFPNFILSREIRMPIFRSPMMLSTQLQQDADLAQPWFKIRRYKLVGISGDIAFYDRIMDAEEIR
jgi:hypothetical protein